MKVTLNWLKEYVDFDLTSEQLSEKLTMLGLEVEEYFTEPRNFSNVVIGVVKSVAKHPDADKLHVCRVSDGQEDYNVICGAPNVKTEGKYPFARVGADLNGFAITARKIRGVKSEGMLCSEAELGLCERSDGIMELPQAAPPGQDFHDYLGEPDTIFDIAITPNRPDCLSVIGIARELAAAIHTPLKKPEVNIQKGSGNIDEYMSVAIKEPDRCYRYSGRLLKNIQIKDSPNWLAERLSKIGIRSINNVVDVTNYMMMETGQPLHAFDYDLIKNKKIIVQTANKGDTFMTLDDQQRELNDDSLMICDAENPVALAGIMGGQNSEVNDNTTRIFLESAYFEPMGIRKTSRQLGLSTDSSRRFERGIDPEGTVYAMERATAILMQVADGKPVGDIIDVYPTKVEPASISISVHYVNKQLGAKLSLEIIQDILNRLQLSTELKNKNMLKVTVPTFRVDLTRPVDLVEEIARCYGYNQIDPVMAPRVDQRQMENEIESYRDKMRHVLTGLGFLETVAFNLVSEKHAQHFAPKGAFPIALLNPISDELAVFRPNILLTLLSTVAYNRNRQMNDLRLFEVGNVAWKTMDNDHIEKTQFGAILAGKRVKQSWLDQPEEFNFYDIKGYVATMLRQFQIMNYNIDKAVEPFWDAESASIRINGLYAGAFGRINQDTCNMFKIKSNDIFAVWFDYDTIFINRRTEKKYEPIPRFPSVPFDLALLVDADIAIADVEKAIYESGGAYLKDVYLFDFYKGDQVEKDKKSVAFSLTFSSKERTLSDDEVDEAVQKILAHLRSTLGAELRPG